MILFVLSILSLIFAYAYPFIVFIKLCPKVVVRKNSDLKIKRSHYLWVWVLMVFMVVGMYTGFGYLLGNIDSYQSVLTVFIVVLCLYYLIIEGFMYYSAFTLFMFFVGMKIRITVWGASLLSYFLYQKYFSKDLALIIFSFQNVILFTIVGFFRRNQFAFKGGIDRGCFHNKKDLES